MARFLIALYILMSQLLFGNNCIDKLGLKKEEIVHQLKDKGYAYIEQCKNISPYLHIVVVNLNDSRNKINIIHSKKTNNVYPLKTITELAKSKPNIVIAINGYTWIGDSGLVPFMRGVAKRPAGTVYDNKKLLHPYPKRTEVVLSFSKRTYKGTKAKLYDKSNGEQIDQNFTVNADNSRTSIIKHGAEHNLEDLYRTSSIGIGKFENMDVLILLSTNHNHKKKVMLEEHYKIFNFFGTKEAMRLDGNSASSLYYNGKHVNKLSGAISFFLSARQIMYSIAVQRVPPIPKPTKKPPVLEGGVNIVPIKGGLKINSRKAQGEVERYEFYRSTQSGILGDKIHTDNVNTYEDKELIDGTTYYYTIKACNEAGCDASTQDYYTYNDNNQTDPTQDPNKVCVSNYFKYYGDGKIHDSLKKGDKDAELYSDGTKHQVKELQEFLEAFGYNVGSSGADGWFGSDTKNALIEFQDANGLDADGIVGPNTREVMNNTNCYDK